MRRLIPSPIEPTTPAILAGRRDDQRPGQWVSLCMVTSLDGGVAVEGRSGGLSCPSDTATLAALRNQADVVLVGAGTVRAEKYGPPRRPNLRIGVVTRRGDGLDLRSPLFAGGAGFLVTTTEAPDYPVATVRCGTETVDLPGALDQLGPIRIHVEGGPQLNGALLDAGLIDELNLTISPHLTGGPEGRIVASRTEHLQRMRLVHLAEENGFVFCRYQRLD